MHDEKFSILMGYARFEECSRYVVLRGILFGVYGGGEEVDWSTCEILKERWKHKTYGHISTELYAILF